MSFWNEKYTDGIHTVAFYYSYGNWHVYNSLRGDSKGSDTKIFKTLSEAVPGSISHFIIGYTIGL